MQDEPEAGTCFSHKMSLKGGFRMLGIDHQHGRWRKAGPGADPGLGRGQRGGTVPLPGPGRAVRVGEPDVAAVGLRGAETRRQGIGAALHCQDDRIQPSPGGALDTQLPGRRRSEAASLSAASICQSVHAGRHRSASRSGRSPRNTERAGHTEDFAAGLA